MLFSVCEISVTFLSCILAKYEVVMGETTAVCELRKRVDLFAPDVDIENGDFVASHVSADLTDNGDSA
jgi:hypothetical protein